VGKFGRLKNPLKAFIVLAVTACLLSVALPNRAKIENAALNSVSITSISSDFALLPVPFTVGNKLTAIRTNKKLSREAAISRLHHLTGHYALYGNSVPDIAQNQSGTSLFYFNIGRACLQVCLFLDLPPPTT
jgi:hypothetical protein